MGWGHNKKKAKSSGKKGRLWALNQPVRRNEERGQSGRSLAEKRRNNQWGKRGLQYTTLQQGFNEYQASDERKKEKREGDTTGKLVDLLPDTECERVAN